MWKKILVIIILFYFFALLQSSFFTHFNLFGIVPNLVFIFFSLLVFFQQKNKTHQLIFLAIIAGFVLDIFSYTYLGPSIVSLIVTGFLLKKIQSLLKNREDSRPFIYFLPLFLVCFTVYEVLFAVYLRFLDPSHILLSFNFKFLVEAVYNLVFASIGFWIMKKYAKTIQN